MTNSATAYCPACGGLESCDEDCELAARMNAERAVIEAAKAWGARHGLLLCGRGRRRAT